MKFYFIGIKGMGMGSLAKILHLQGHTVIGSDVPEYFKTQRALDQQNIPYFNYFDQGENITKFQPDIIVYSGGAYNSENNAEVAFALQTDIPTIPYFQFLGENFTDNFQIAVSGTHGKTTTTAIINSVLEQLPQGDNFLTTLIGDGQSSTVNKISNEQNIFLVEACEYKNHFHNLNPNILIITSLEWEHIDFFKTPKEYYQSFATLVEKLPADGLLICEYDAYQKLKSKDIAMQRLSPENIITYGEENGQIKLENWQIKNGQQIFDLNSNKYGHDASCPTRKHSPISYTLNAPLKHNCLNAITAILVGEQLGLTTKQIQQGLLKFPGAKRRQELMYTSDNLIIMDDYGHHPTEVNKTVTGLKEFYTDYKFITVFHPHTFTRTAQFLDEFVAGLEPSDINIVVEIFGSAREEQGTISSRDIVNRLKEQKKEAYFATDLHHAQEQVEKLLATMKEQKVFLLLLGAGDSYEIGERIIEKF